MPLSRRTSVPLVLLAVLALSLTSCASMQQTYKDNPKAVLGSLGGAALGAGIIAIAGGNPGAIVAGAVGGGLLGGFVGKKLDDRDKKMASEAARRAFEENRTGQSTEWRNPDTGNSGSVTPTKTYQLANGQYCRQYSQDITIGNEKHQTHGTACRQADGTWKVQS